MMSKNAALPLLSSPTKCCLLYGVTEVTDIAPVVLTSLPGRFPFRVTPREVLDVFLDFTISSEQLTITLYEPTDLDLQPATGAATHLPPMVIRTSIKATLAEFARFNLGRGLSPKIVVTRCGRDSEPIIGVNVDGSVACPSPPGDDKHWRLTWKVGGRPRSLLFAPAGAAEKVPLILRPKRED